MMKIVIAEDERIIALGLSSVLRKLGHTVLDICPSGERCIESVDRERPDVIFMDIRMDGLLDGIETAAILKERYGTPIVFTTAFGDEDTRRRAQAVSPSAFLVKPIIGTSIRDALMGIELRS